MTRIGHPVGCSNK